MWNCVAYYMKSHCASRRDRPQADVLQLVCLTNICNTWVLATPWERWICTNIGRCLSPQTVSKSDTRHRNQQCLLIVKSRLCSFVLNKQRCDLCAWTVSIISYVEWSNTRVVWTQSKWPVYPRMNICQIHQLWEQYHNCSLGSLCDVHLLDTPVVGKRLLTAQNPPLLHTCPIQQLALLPWGRFSL